MQPRQHRSALRNQRAHSRLFVRPPHEAPPQGAELASHLLIVRIFLDYSS